MKQDFLKILVEEHGLPEEMVSKYLDSFGDSIEDLEKFRIALANQLLELILETESEIESA